MDGEKTTGQEITTEVPREGEIIGPSDLGMEVIDDLSELSTIKGANDGAVLHLKSPNGGAPLYCYSLEDKAKPKEERRRLPMRLTMLGQDSTKWRRFIQKTANKRYARESTRGGFTKQEEIESDDLALAITITKSWENIQMDGKALPFNDHFVKTFYQAFPWAMEQALSFARDRSNFLRDASTS